ncbi:Nocturnin [Oopsacas minuta]|uniref:Nocturnin n=1 Tax=Oopsacas minuta TaxID=111878 RepID=A0AAV7KCD0_9METZ|nr:Nocturnin [Oopsacas minuta]
MEIVVTSTKDLKIAAVKRGFSRIFENVLCEGISIPDQVAAQPIGFEAGREGAWGRIRHLRNQYFSHPRSSRIAVSIENFITEISPGAYFDVGCVAIDDPHNRIKLDTFSQCISVPKEFMEKAKSDTSKSYHLRDTGYEITAGEVIQKENPHIPAADFHRRFCGISREQLLTTACQVLASEYAKELIGKSTKEIPCRVYISRNKEIGDNAFRLLQWNVLAQALMGTDIVKPIKERVPLFQRELLAYQPDIICLQEADLFYDFFKPFLSGQGFVGEFLPKMNSPCLEQVDNIGPCGCALFYRETVFRFLEKHEYVLLNELNRASNQVLLSAELEHITTSRRITVAVTHLKAMLDKHEIRLAQSKDLINKLKSINCDDIIIAGDFNYIPEEPSYKYMSNQTVIPVKSVYGEIKEPEYTCQWVNPDGDLNESTLDYIWYTGNKLEVSGFFKTPENVKSMIYASYYPSDHWPLIADFIVY